jgi:hypothetical protein
LESGHLKWKPAWRYGTITELAGDSANVTLIALPARVFRGEAAMDLDEAADLTLSAVPIEYPPCNGQVFAVGDQVLLQYTNFDRAAPKIIGFRREPRPCPAGGRVSWR